MARSSRAVLAALCLAVSGTAVGPDASAETAPAIPVKISRYAETIIARYDRDGDHRLNSAEWAAMQGKPAAIDADEDGQITVGEYAAHVARYAQRRRIRLMPALPGASPPLPSLLGPTEDTAASASSKAASNVRRFTPAAARLAGVPEWFKPLDADGDGQLTLVEFAPRQTPSAIKDFSRYDRDGDGVITPYEGRRGPSGQNAEAAESPATEESSAEATSASNEPAAAPSDAAAAPDEPAAAPAAAEPAASPEAAPADTPAPAERPSRRGRRPKPAA